MGFYVRPVQAADLSQLVDLAKQFNLLNLPGDKKILSAKIEKSLGSFKGLYSKANSEYLFVVIDSEENLVVGSSLVLAKHGTEEVPHNYFKVLKRQHNSQDLGIGFIHQVLRYEMDIDGPTEIGGLLVDKVYRRRPEKLGKLASLSRFVFMGLHPDRFEHRVLCELTPPLGEDGRSDFWESLGRRFTGLPYQEADVLSQSHKEFISSLFPAEDVYLCLLDTKARSVLGRVGSETKPAQHLLESIGFSYIDEVDPFDGGPHYACDLKKIGPIAKGGLKQLAQAPAGCTFTEQGILGHGAEGFRCIMSAYYVQGTEIYLPEASLKLLNADYGTKLWVAPSSYSIFKTSEQR